MASNYEEINRLLLETMEADPNISLISLMKLVQRSFFVGAKSFDEMIKEVEENSLDNPERLRDSIRTLKVFGMIVMGFATGSSRKLFTDLTT